MNTEKFLAQRRANAEKQQQRQENQKSNIPFLKLPQGKHPVRFLPKGNKQEGLPYKSVQTHTFKLKADGGGTIWVYALCYNWLFSHPDAKEVTINPLRELGKLTKEDVKAFQKYGCPVCNAKDALYKSGAAKETWQQCGVRGTNYWNVLLRSDSKVYVWSVSDTNHDALSGSIEMYLDLDEVTGKPGPDARDILHPVKGYDHIITATGEKNNRRYKVDIKPKSLPIGELADDQKPLDLMTVVAESLKPYGEMCQLLRRQCGKELAQLGFNYGILLPEEKKAKNDDWDDDEEEEVKPKSKSIPWDNDDEDNPKPKKNVKANSNDLKPKKKKVEVIEEEEDDEEEEVPVKKLKSSPPRKKVQVIEEDEEEEDDEYEEEEDEGQDDDYDDDVEDIEEDGDDDGEEETYMKGGNLYSTKTGKKLL